MKDKTLRLIIGGLVGTNLLTFSISVYCLLSRAATAPSIQAEEFVRSLPAKLIAEKLREIDSERRNLEADALLESWRLETAGRKIQAEKERKEAERVEAVAEEKRVAEATRVAAVAELRAEVAKMLREESAVRETAVSKMQKARVTEGLATEFFKRIGDVVQAQGSLSILPHDRTADNWHPELIAAAEKINRSRDTVNQLLRDNNQPRYYFDFKREHLLADQKKNNAALARFNDAKARAAGLSQLMNSVLDPVRHLSAD